MKRLLPAVLALAGIAGVACYKDDALTHAPAISPTKVFLTDDPFPYGNVSSVNIYVTKIEANAALDTTGHGGNWVTIATPNKSFELLTLQQGDTAFVGQSAIDAGLYSTIRMMIDVDQSSIKYFGDTNAVIHWPSTGQVAFYAGVQPQPLSVAATGATLVIDFDVGSTFVYNSSTHDFTVQSSALRAVNSARAGAIAGQVTRKTTGSTATVPVPNADVSVYVAGGNSGTPYATGRTDLNGAYRVGFLPAGTYAVLFQQPALPQFSAVTSPNVIVTAGATSPVNVLLSFADTAGTARYVSVTGPDSVSPFGSVRLYAFVVDSNHLVTNPLVTWVSRDPSIAVVAPDTPAVVDTVANAIVGGVTVGSTWIVASNGGVADSLLMNVVNPPPPPAGVATVTLTPANLPNLVVGDSVYLVATLKDSSGNVVTNGTVNWNFVSGQDSTVVDIYSFGLQALIRAKRTGSTIIQAMEPISYAYAKAAVTVH